MQELILKVENGTVTTNVQALNAALPEILESYNYPVDAASEKTAKADKVKLNKMAKDLDDKRKAFEAKVFGQWKSDSKVLTEIAKAYKAKAKELGAKIDEIHEAEKEAKRDWISKKWMDMTTGTPAEGVPLALVYDEKWMNKTATAARIEADMGGSILRIKDKHTILKTQMEAMQVPEEVMKQMYDAFKFDPLRDDWNHELAILKTATEAMKKHEEEMKQEEVVPDSEDDLPFDDDLPEYVEDTSELRTHTITFTCTELEMEGIMAYLNSCYIDWEEV